MNRTVQGHTGSGISGDSRSRGGTTRSPFNDSERVSSSERQELRRHFRRKRRALGAVTQRRHAQAVARHFFRQGLPLRGRTVGLYFAQDGEVDLKPLLSRLLQTRKRLALPVVRPNGTMAFHRYRRRTRLVRNRYGILEPAPGAASIPALSIDLLLMPLVAFDDFGGRLGMGAGYYDRYLGRVPRPLRPLLVGVAHEAQRSLDPLPYDDWDVPMDGVLTEQGFQSFGWR